MLYITTTLEGQSYDRLVVPIAIKDIVLEALQDNMGHQGRDRSYLFRWQASQYHIKYKYGTCVYRLSVARSFQGRLRVYTCHHWLLYTSFTSHPQQESRPFDNFFAHCGFPSKLHSDKAQHFESKVIQHFCVVARIWNNRKTPYNPMENDQV